MATDRVLGRVSLSDLKNTATSISKTNFQFLSSYNWLPHKTGTSGALVVPGLPSQWDPPELPQALPPDSGLVFINQNAYRHPKCPLEPLFQALLTTQPSFDLNQIHIIGDRNNLRQLFDHVCGQAKDEFVIALEMVNNTALLTRLEPATSEIVNPAIKFRGFGHEFEKAFTKVPKMVAGTTSHHRIVGYTFGGLNLLIRFEADAALLPAKATSAHSPQQVAPTTDSNTTGGTAEDLLGKLSSLSLSTGTDKNPTKLAVKVAGELIPQEHIIEIKTRAQHRPITVQECMPQLWFSDTRHLYVGLHRGGNFGTVIKHTVDDTVIAQWELTYKKQLGKLVHLLEKILEIAKRNGGRMKIRCVNGSLSVEEWVDTPQVALEKLPEHLRENWSKEI